MFKLAFGLVLLVICHPLVALAGLVVSGLFWFWVMYRSPGRSFARLRHTTFVLCVVLSTFALTALCVSVFGIRFGCVGDSMCCGRSFAGLSGSCADSLLWT